MTVGMGEFYGGWYVMAFRESRTIALVYGPCRRADELEHLVTGARQAALDAGYTGVTADVTFGLGVSFASTLYIGACNTPKLDIVTDPFDLMSLDFPAKYMVRKPLGLKADTWGGRGKSW